MDHLEPVQLYPPWKDAEEKFIANGYHDGRVVPHRWFYEAFGLEMPSAAMTFAEGEKVNLARLQQFVPFKRALLEDHNADLVSVPGEGYKVIPACEQTAEALSDGLHEVKRALRGMFARLSHIDHPKLTDEQRKENADALAKAAMMAGMVRKSVKYRSIAELEMHGD